MIRFQFVTSVLFVFKACLLIHVGFGSATSNKDVVEDGATTPSTEEVLCSKLHLGKNGSFFFFTFLPLFLFLIPFLNPLPVSQSLNPIFIFRFFVFFR